MLMNHKKLLLKSLVVLGLLALGGNVFAQSDTTRGKGNSFFLNFGGNLGGSSFVEKSVLPYKFGGLTTDIHGGFTDEWKRCHIQHDFGWMHNVLIEPTGSAHYFYADLEFLYSCLKPSAGRWHFWTGASFGGFMDLKLISDLQNAQTTISIFGIASLEELVQCDFAYDKKDNTRPWLTASLRVSLPVFAFGSRPGFAYVQPPLNDESVMELLTRQNEPVNKWFPGYSYDLGLTLNLRNGNRIAFGHRVEFFSTGKKGAYRYDRATRSGYVTFMFKI